MELRCPSTNVLISTSPLHLTKIPQYHRCISQTLVRSIVQTLTRTTLGFPSPQTAQSRFVLIKPPSSTVCSRFFFPYPCRDKDNHLDAYLRVIKGTDPLHTALVFSSGRGSERTTFGMVAAILVRRRQLMVKGINDPYPSRGVGSGTPPTGASTVRFRLTLTGRFAGR